MNLERTFLIAEIGINHNGDIDLAKKMIRAAAHAGADAVKFQNYRTEDFLPNRSLTYSYISQGKKNTESQFEMFKRCELSSSDLKTLKDCCDYASVEFLSTPTSIHGIAELKKLGVKWLKNGSDYLGHLPLIQEMGRSGIPTILSTGMAFEKEITDAVDAFRSVGGRELILLACTSAYPTPPDNLHLRRIPALAKIYNCSSGFSDHSAGWEAAVAAVFLGACVIEKHFTTDRKLAGPDQSFSATPDEYAELVRQVRKAETMLGCSELRPTHAEEKSRKDFRLSCTAARDLPAGAILQKKDILFQRPATGLPPRYFKFLLGRSLTVSVRKGEVLQLAHLEK